MHISVDDLTDLYAVINNTTGFSSLLSKATVNKRLQEELLLYLKRAWIVPPIIVSTYVYVAISLMKFVKFFSDPFHIIWDGFQNDSSRHKLKTQLNTEQL